MWPCGKWFQGAYEKQPTFQNDCGPNPMKLKLSLAQSGSILVNLEVSSEQVWLPCLISKVPRHCANNRCSWIAIFIVGSCRMSCRHKSLSHHWVLCLTLDQRTECTHVQYGEELFLGTESLTIQGWIVNNQSSAYHWEHRSEFQTASWAGNLEHMKEWVPALAMQSRTPCTWP